VTPDPQLPDAVVFDFDGLVLDTEWAIYESARAAFSAHGHDLTVEAWATVVGLNDDTVDDWWERLCAAAGVADFERQLYEAAYAAQDRSSRDTLQPLPGIVGLLDELADHEVPVGVASSSSSAWLHRHLGRLGLLDRFGAVIGSDLCGGVGKPEPDVYLRACADLAADPTRSVALEDSAPGVTAARAAGMTVVAVPSRITAYHRFDHADAVVASVADVDLAVLAELARNPGAGAPGTRARTS
jgi:putative hydrolase of the HAD superfamily